jgi:type IV pilus assembly protein PilB
LPPFLIASSLIAIMAQRLVRTICPKCREPYKPSPVELRAAGINADRLGSTNFLRGRGCNYCHHSGYRGRLGVFELLRMNTSVREMAFNREPTQAIRQKARQLGMRGLLEDGVQKAIKGITTLEEVLSTCHHESTIG